MRQPRIIMFLLVLLVCLVGLPACTSGHVGSNEIAFLRDGHLWTIDPDGANAFEVVVDGPTVIGYSWSPNHQIFVFRTLDESFAKTAAARHLISDPVTGLIADLPSTLNTIGIDGGSPIPIIFSISGVQHSDAWWNTTGTRLLYREEVTSTTQNPGIVLWWVSQNDQPVGIARKLLPSTFSIPSFAPDNSSVIGVSANGVFSTTLAGSNRQFVVRGPLPGHPFFATLERVLWQPAHQQPAILYAIAVPPTQATTSVAVQLILRTVNGRTTVLATCTCNQFAWSPDGNRILYSTGSNYTVFDLKGNSSFTISNVGGSVPYWSPDSQFLLLDGLHTLKLVQLASQQEQVLLSDANSPEVASPVGAGTNGLLQPVLNSPWAADSRRFLFLTHHRLLWRGQGLSSGNGLYAVSIDGHGQPQGVPVVVDTGNDLQAGWTYEDANTSFLF